MIFLDRKLKNIKSAMCELNKNLSTQATCEYFFFHENKIELSTYNNKVVNIRNKL